MPLIKHSTTVDLAELVPGEDAPRMVPPWWYDFVRPLADPVEWMLGDLYPDVDGEMVGSGLMLRFRLPAFVRVWAWARCRPYRHLLRDGVEDVMLLSLAMQRTPPMPFMPSYPIEAPSFTDGDSLSVLRKFTITEPHIGEDDGL